jgi:putative membrane protein
MSRLGWSIATTVAAMVATPFARRRRPASDVLTTVVVAGLAATTLERTMRRPGRPGRVVGAMLGIGWFVEWLGTRTGRPFGRYEYTGRLRPTLGGVPVVVPLAWFAMAGPAREVAGAVLGGRSSRRARVVVGASALTAWDLFLDPQMVMAGHWRWSSPGGYRGVPLSNFVGWWGTAAVMMWVAEVLDPPGERPVDGVLVGQYAGMAVMETAAFASFFADRRVAAAGGVAMLPLAVVALRRGFA